MIIPPDFDACCRLVIHLVVSTDVLSTYTTYTGPIPNPYLYPKLCQKTDHIPRTYTGTIELLPWRSWESRKYLPYKCICKRKILLLPGLGFRGYTWLYRIPQTLNRLPAPFRSRAAQAFLNDLSLWKVSSSTNSGHPTVFATRHIGLIHTIVVVGPWANSIKRSEMQKVEFKNSYNLRLQIRLEYPEICDDKNP